jgi:hypothetical protein
MRRRAFWSIPNQKAQKLQQLQILSSQNYTDQKHK